MTNASVTSLNAVLKALYSPSTLNAFYGIDRSNDPARLYGYKGWWRSDKDPNDIMKELCAG